MENVSGNVSQDDRTWGMLCHLSSLAGWVIPFGNIIAPLVIWLWKKDQSWFVNENGKESLNFQISLTIYGIISGLLVLVLIGFLLLAALAVFWVVCTVLATIKANQGQMYRYPLTLRLVK